MPKHRNKGETVYFEKIKVKRGSTVELPKREMTLGKEFVNNKEEINNNNKKGLCYETYS